MSAAGYGSAAAMALVRRAPVSGSPELNGAARRVVAELRRWYPLFERGDLWADGNGWAGAAAEHFAVRISGVRSAGLGFRPVRGVLQVTDHRAVLLGPAPRAVRHWELADLATVTALGNWGGVALVHPGGDTELVVAAGTERPSWRDAAAWLKVEAAFAAAEDRLGPWVDELPRRLALVGDA